MKRTWRGKGGLLVALVLYLLAYGFATVTPALLATLLLAYLATAHARFRLLIQRLDATAHAHPPDRTPRQGDPLEIPRTLHLEPPGLYATATAESTHAYTVHEVRLERDDETPHGTTFTATVRLSPTQRGRIEQPSITLTLTDPEDLYEHDVTLHAPAEFTAHAAPHRFQQSRHAERLRRLLHATPSTPQAHASRAYHSNEPTRRVDWKASSRHPRLIARLPPQERATPLTVILDASETMRHRTPRGCMLDHARTLATTLLETRHRQGSPAGLLVHDDERVLTEIPPRRDEAQSRRVHTALEETPKPLDVAPEDTAYVVREPPAEPDMTRFELPHDDTPDATVFEKPLATLPNQDGPDGLTRALARASLYKPPGTIVLVTDLETHPDRAERAVQQALRYNHRVVIASTFTPFMHLNPNTLTANLLEDVYNAWNRHHHLEQRLETSGAEVIDLAPQTPTYELFTTLTPAPRKAPPGGPTP